MPSCCSSTRCGRTSTKPRSRAALDRIRRRASGGSAADERARRPQPRRRSSLIALALVAAVLGGYVFAVLVAAAATVMYLRMDRGWSRGWGVGWNVGGFVYACSRRSRCCGSATAPNPGPGSLICCLGVHRHLVDRHRRLFRRPRDRRAASWRRRSAPTRPSPGLSAAWSARRCSAGPGSCVTELAARCFCGWRRCSRVAAQVGDLFESWLKRRAGVKDSGDLAARPWRPARPARRTGPGRGPDRRLQLAGLA